jgi:hypothetical protein
LGVISKFEQVNLEELDLRKTTLNNLKEICVIARNWTDNAPDRDYLRELMGVALKLRVP